MNLLDPLAPAQCGKVRYARADAIAVARELCALLKPFTHRLIVAGSLRRRKQFVGDVEILYIPKLEPRRRLRQVDAFAPPTVEVVNLADVLLDSLVSRAVILQRKSVTGSISWGGKNKYATDVATGIPVDFFAATTDNWWNYLVCRTGGATNNTLIATAAQDRGLQWHPYAHGFTNRAGRWLRVRSERAVFAIAGLPYLEPWER